MGGKEVREKRRRKEHGGNEKESEEEREEANREDERIGDRIDVSEPARCSKTRWRVDGEAMAAERPSCSLGYLPIKAGTLLFTQEDKATANPTDSESATT